MGCLKAIHIIPSASVVILGLRHTRLFLCCLVSALCMLPAVLYYHIWCYCKWKSHHPSLPTPWSPWSIQGRTVSSGHPCWWQSDVVYEPTKVALGLSPELLHHAKGKVDNLGVVRSLRMQQHSCIQTRWGSSKGILALPSSQCLKLPCIVCPMLRVSPQR